jgi:trans-L-3-hydroxyproline dehydratase
MAEVTSFDPRRAATWAPPSRYRRIVTVDGHTGGEPFRVVLSGAPAIPGDTMVAKRAWAETHLDELRRVLMWEPRGHADMYGCFLTEPVSPGADFGVLFIHNDGFSTMCGHGIIAIATTAITTGMIPSAGAVTPLGIDTPAGLIRAEARQAGDRVERVEFVNVPSFVDGLDQVVDVPDLGPVRYDLASGGAYYAYVDAPTLGLELEPAESELLVEVGRDIKRAVMASRPIRHPTTPELGFLYGTIFVGPGSRASSHSRHVCIFANGELDRSPTGTGVSARLAILAARGELEPGRRITIESILGSEFGGTIVGPATLGDRAGIVPRVDGQANLVGRSEFWIDREDVLGGGFLLR